VWADLQYQLQTAGKPNIAAIARRHNLTIVQRFQKMPVFCV
jgi:predicted nucleic acid-binding protein